MIHQINKEIDSMIDIHVPNKQKDKLTKLMNNDKNSHTIKQTKKKNRQKYMNNQTQTEIQLSIDKKRSLPNIK